MFYRMFVMFSFLFSSLPLSSTAVVLNHSRVIVETLGATQNAGQDRLML